MSFQLKSLEEDKDRILATNCVLAQENVDKEPEIIERKGRLNELSEEGKELCSVVQEKLNTLSEYSKCKCQIHNSFASGFSKISIK